MLSLPLIYGSISSTIVKNPEIIVKQFTIKNSARANLIISLITDSSLISLLLSNASSQSPIRKKTTNNTVAITWKAAERFLEMAYPLPSAHASGCIVSKLTAYLQQALKALAPY